MLGSFDLVTTIPVTDLDRAKRYYCEVLGLRFIDETSHAVRLSAKTGQVSLFKRGPTKADHTVMHFEVSGIDGIVAALRARGVEILEYDSGPLRTTNGIAQLGTMRGAWIKDTEGNIVGLREAAP